MCQKDLTCFFQWWWRYSVNAQCCRVGHCHIAGGSSCHLKCRSSRPGQWDLNKSVPLLCLVPPRCRSRPCIHCIPQSCYHDASGPTLGLSLLHDAHLPRSGQSGEEEWTRYPADTLLGEISWLKNSFALASNQNLISDLKFLILLQSEHVLRNVGGLFHLAANFDRIFFQKVDLYWIHAHKNDESFYQVASSAVCVCGEFGDSCGGHVPWDVQEGIPPRAADPGNVCGLLLHRAHHVYRGEDPFEDTFPSFTIAPRTPFWAVGAIKTVAQHLGLVCSPPLSPLSWLKCQHLAPAGPSAELLSIDGVLSCSQI